MHSVTAIGMMLHYLLGRSLSLADLALPRWGDRVRRTTKSFALWFCTSDRRPEDISIRPEPDHCLPMSLTECAGHVVWREFQKKGKWRRSKICNKSLTMDQKLILQTAFIEKKHFWQLLLSLCSLVFYYSEDEFFRWNLQRKISHFFSFNIIIGVPK